MVFYLRLREPHRNFNDNQVVVLLVRVSDVTVSPSVISWVRGCHGGIFWRYGRISVCIVLDEADLV